jgi:hypothetical protein
MIQGSSVMMLSLLLGDDTVYPPRVPSQNIFHSTILVLLLVPPCPASCIISSNDIFPLPKGGDIRFLRKIRLDGSPGEFLMIQGSSVMMLSLLLGDDTVYPPRVPSQSIFHSTVLVLLLVPPCPASCIISSNDIFPLPKGGDSRFLRKTEKIVHINTGPSFK